jgi:hypothetical protein
MELSIPIMATDTIASFVPCSLTDRTYCTNTFITIYCPFNSAVLVRPINLRYTKILFAVLFFFVCVALWVLLSWRCFWWQQINVIKLFTGILHTEKIKTTCQQLLQRLWWMDGGRPHKEPDRFSQYSFYVDGNEIKFCWYLLHRQLLCWEWNSFRTIRPSVPNACRCLTRRWAPNFTGGSFETGTLLPHSEQRKPGNCKEYSPSLETGSFSAGHEIPLLLWNRKVHQKPVECNPYPHILFP